MRIVLVDGVDLIKGESTWCHDKALLLFIDAGELFFLHIYQPSFVAGEYCRPVRFSTEKWIDI